MLCAQAAKRMVQTLHGACHQDQEDIDRMQLLYVPIKAGPKLALISAGSLACQMTPLESKVSLTCRTSACLTSHATRRRACPPAARQVTLHLLSSAGLLQEASSWSWEVVLFLCSLRRQLRRCLSQFSQPFACAGGQVPLSALSRLELTDC